LLIALRQGLAESQYVEGSNIAIEYRWAEGQYDRFPALAADLLRRQAAVIVAGDAPSALAAKAATSIDPIVFNSGGDPQNFGRQREHRGRFRCCLRLDFARAG
jgi:putative tryptophan/tyrosine transport system substrate-binding protein